MRSPVAVRCQVAGSGSVESLARRAKSSSSIRCCVPIRVAFSRPERIQRRTVSGLRFVRRAASGTVSIVAIYYNNSTPSLTATAMANDGSWRHSAVLSEFGPPFLNGAQRSVNRKVQGSNPWSGANLVCKFG